MNICRIVRTGGSFLLSKSFATWVCEKREKRGLSQRQLAARAGVSAPMISKVESGGSAGSPEMVNKIADALEVSRAEAMSAWVSSESGQELTYVTDDDARIVAEAYEGLPPDSKAIVKGMVLSAAELAKKIDREETIGGIRADHDDNPSRDAGH